MTRRLLVVSTVHSADDTRIRQRLIPSLQRVGEVTFASRAPAPADFEGFRWVELPGSRWRRNLAAYRLTLGKSWDVVVAHDPELLPLSIVAGLIGRRIVFDVHEDVPAQLRTKQWLPALLRPAVALLAAQLLRLAERVVTITLAEANYQHLFGSTHPTFPNHLPNHEWPQPTERSRRAVYVGDVTAQRGADLAVAACGSVGVPLTLVGPVEERFRDTLHTLASRTGCDLEVTGRLAFPEAMERAAVCSVGLSPLRDIPNYRHSLPTKLFEYAALGLPIVASRLPGSEAVGHHLPSVVWFESWTVDDMGAAVVEALDRVAEAEEGAASVRSRFTWPDDEVVAFYTELISREGNPAPN